MKFELKKTWHLLSCLVGGFIAISILAFSFIALMYRLNDFCLSSWVIPSGAECMIASGVLKDTSETIRNFAWIFWMLLSLSGAGLGLWLAWRGRQIQQESHLQERYEKAADMLSSELEATRIAACLSLANLGKADKSMKNGCIQLLFAFMSKPYLEKNEAEIYIRLKGRKKNEYLNDLFSPNERLRPDIQAAVDSFFAIYEYYSKSRVDNEVIRLPEYYWKNMYKNLLFLVKANLRSENLKGAILWYADLRGAEFPLTSMEGINLYRAKLQGADLRRISLRKADLGEANLTRADISNARLYDENRLTKEQILSAKWGYSDIERFNGPPQLSRDLMQDEDIKKWLEKPAYNKKTLGKIGRIRYEIGKFRNFFR